MRPSHDVLERPACGQPDADISRATAKRSNASVAAPIARPARPQIWLLALQQPVAGDLRNIFGAIQIIADVDRMGALAVHIAKIARRRHPNCAVPEMKSLAAITHTGGPRSLSRFPGRCLARLTRRGQAVRALFSARRNVLPVPWAFAGHMNEYCAVFGCRGMAAAMRSHVEPSCSDGLFAAGALRVGGHMFLTSLASLSRPSLSAPSTQDVAGLGQLDARRIVSLLFRELFQAVKEVVWGVVAAAAALKP